MYKKDKAFEMAIIEQYHRPESSVEEVLIEIHLAGVSVRRVEDITETADSTQLADSFLLGLQTILRKILDDTNLLKML